MEAAKRSHNYYQYALVLETGLGMHALRHTYVSKAMESGTQPKALQKLPGHASIQTTMDRYVHVTDESMSKAIRRFEENSIEQMV